MNWYKRAQVVNYQGIVNSIYQRLMQAERDGPDPFSATDDIANQGIDPQTTEQAIKDAIAMMLGPDGDESMLTDAQRHVISTLRGWTPQQAVTEVEPEQDYGLVDQTLQL